MKSYFYKYCILCIGTFLSVSSNAQISTADSVQVVADSTLSANDSLVTQYKDTSAVSTTDPSYHLYRMNYWVSGIFCAVASVADVYAIPTVIKSKRAITTAEIQGLNRDALSGLDRWALEQDPTKRQMYLNAADYGLPVIIVAPALLAFNKNIRKDWFRILLMYYEMHSITFTIYNYSFFGPAFQNKFRPVVYYTQLPIYERNVGNNRNSMYSGHVATAVASTFFMVKVYCDYHPEIGGQKYLWYAAATLPGLLMGYFRVKGLEHFPSDVLVGTAIGAACGILVPEIHRFKNHKVQFGVSSAPLGGGAGLGMTWDMD